MRETKDKDIAVFQNRLAQYKKLIDKDIAAYSESVRKLTKEKYGPSSELVANNYLDILNRGGKRLRGALTIVGYEMSGGSYQPMIVEAARAVEMLHAYILIIDDIQDKSALRRGLPAAHLLLANYYKKQRLGKDPTHFGQAMAINGALIGNHAAQMVVANLNAPDELKTKALSILNRGLLVTGHGQINDGFNQLLSNVSLGDVDKVMQWKTAYYSFLNPLHLGMILAGGVCSDTDQAATYSLHAGRAFQISDDILGTFGSQKNSGKSPMDDLREGKATLLVVYALKHATPKDQKFLHAQLGNEQISNTDFKKIKQILSSCGALDFAKTETKKEINLALSVLQTAPTNWSDEGKQFLRGLAYYLTRRNK